MARHPAFLSGKKESRGIDPSNSFLIKYTQQYVEAPMADMDEANAAEKQVDQYKPQKIVEGQKVENFIPVGGKQAARDYIQKQ